MTLKIDTKAEKEVSEYKALDNESHNPALAAYRQADQDYKAGIQRANDLEKRIDETDEQQDLEIERQAQRLANGQMPSTEIPDSSQLRTDLKIQLKANDILKAKRTEAINHFQNEAARLKRKKRSVAMAFLNDNGFRFSGDKGRSLDAVSNLTLGDVAKLAAAYSIAADRRVTWLEFLKSYVSNHNGDAEQALLKDLGL